MILGSSAQYVKNKMQIKAVRIILGCILILFGVNQVFNIVPLMSHAGMQHQH